MERDIKQIHVATVREMMHLMGIDNVRHPLVEVVDMADIRDMNWYDDYSLSFGFYMVVYKERGCGTVMYGLSQYDYDNGTLLFFGPNQKISLGSLGNPSGKILMFDSELLYEMPIQMERYSFFGYSVNEALHISEREKEQFFTQLQGISDELEHALDKHSRELLVSQITVMLNYCLRFYDRQFISREILNDDLLSRFRKLIEQYFQSSRPRQEGLPGVKYFAQELHLSPNYFGDMISKQTGMSPQTHIQRYVMDIAKHRLRTTDEPVSNIAWDLGFEYAQYFNRIFKKYTGMTPTEFRQTA